MEQLLGRALRHTETVSFILSSFGEGYAFGQNPGEACPLLVNSTFFPGEEGPVLCLPPAVSLCPVAQLAIQFFCLPGLYSLVSSIPLLSACKLEGLEGFGYFYFQGWESTLFVPPLIFFACDPQIFESGFERRLTLDFSEVMFAMKQFEQVSEILSLGFILFRFESVMIK